MGPSTMKHLETSLKCASRGPRPQKESLVLAACRDVRWSKFVGTGKERNAFPFKKKSFSFPFFFRFFSFLERVFPLFPIFLGISHPVLRRSFPVFLSFHLSKPVPGFLMGLKLAILERVLNKYLCKPVPRCSSNRSSPFLKSFLVFPQPVFLSNKEKRESRTASVLKGYILASMEQSIRFK